MNAIYGLRDVALAAIFAALYMITATLVGGAPPSPRLGLRGMRRQKYLEENEKWRMIDPLVRWLGGKLNPFVDDKMRKSLDARLTLAGDPLGLVPEELVALSALCAFVGCIGGILANEIAKVGFPIVAACAIVGAMAPSSALSEAQANRYKNINRGLPHAIDLLALGMGAGLDFPAAVRQVVEKQGNKDDLGQELTLLLQGLELGQTRAQVLRRFADRVPTDPVKDFVGAVVQAEERGNPVVPVLRIQADVSRQRRSVRAEEAATKAGVALVLPLILIFLAAVLLILGPTMLKIKEGFNS